MDIVKKDLCLNTDDNKKRFLKLIIVAHNVPTFYFYIIVYFKLIKYCLGKL